jgi:hypothetical protein
MITGAFCVAGFFWFTLQLPKINAVMYPIYQEKSQLPLPNEPEVAI